MASRPLRRNHFYWTDVISPSTLRFHDKTIELEYQKLYRCRRAPITAFGSLVEGSMNLFLAARAFAPQYWQLQTTPLSLRRMHYAIVIALLLPVVRGFPYLWWVSNQAHFTDWLLFSCLASRLASVVVYALHNMAHAHMYNMIMLYQFAVGIPIDMLTNLLVSSIVKQVPFAVHVPLMLLECATVVYTIASRSGLCSAILALARAKPCPLVKLPVSRAEEDALAFSTTPCDSLKDAPQWLGPASRLLLRGIAAPPWAACVNSCQEISDVDVRHANSAAAALQQAMGWVNQLIRWLAFGVPLQLTPPLGNASSACAGAALVAVTALAAVVIGRLYVKEALDRCRMWQEKHPGLMLHPPAAQLRHVLLVQAGCCGLVAVLAVAGWSALVD